MHETFITKNFRKAALEKIDQANAIIEAYQAQGYKLSLRQLYYQFVARDLIPNKQSEYKKLGTVINDARLAGLIDWAAIEDLQRNVQRLATWDSPEDGLAAIAEQYREPLWRNQPYRPEVWIEKDALTGVIKPICQKYRVPYIGCRGYMSQSEQYDAGKRFQTLLLNGVKPLVIHLGDHDPSGLDMTRDNTDRLSLFARNGIEVRRIALNMDQIDQYGPPPNPAKSTDSRFYEYKAEFGDESWELDALEPKVISDLIEAELLDVIDEYHWEKDAKDEARNKSALNTIVDRWDEVADMIEDAWGGEED